MKTFCKYLALSATLFIFACSSDSGTGTSSSSPSSGDNLKVDNSACIAMAEKYLPIPSSLPEMYSTALNWVPNGNSSCVSKVKLSALSKSYDSYYQILVMNNWGEKVGDDIPLDVRQYVNSEKYMYYNHKEDGGFKVVFQMWLSSNEEGGYDFNAVFSIIGNAASGSLNPYSTDVEYVARTYMNGIFSTNYINNLSYQDESTIYWAYPTDKTMVDYIMYDRDDVPNLLKANGWENVYSHLCSVTDVANDGILVAGNAQTSTCIEIIGTMVYNGKPFDISVRVVSNGGTQSTFAYLDFLGWLGL